MKFVLIVIIVLAAVVLVLVYARPQIKMELSSMSFEDNRAIPSRFTCDGGNLSPYLKIKGTPSDAQSLALIVDDPDASNGGTFTHWIMWNIPTEVTDMFEGRFPPEAVQGKNDFGNNSYGGPCPPSGTTHHYRFKLYALDSQLSLSPESTVQDLLPEIEKHLIEKSEVIGIYKRP